MIMAAAGISIVLGDMDTMLAGKVVHVQKLTIPLRCMDPSQFLYASMEALPEPGYKGITQPAASSHSITDGQPALC